MSIIHHPELKVFNIREAYRIRGIDISHYSDISRAPSYGEFQKLRNANLRFVYMKASEGATFKDNTFVNNLVNAVNNHLDVGIYHVFSPCSPPAGQLRNIQEQVEAAEKRSGKFNLLPIAIDTELAFQAPFSQCAAGYKERLHDMLRMVEQAFGKKPL